MERHIEQAACVRKQRKDMEDCRAHGPEAMRGQREPYRRGGPEEIDCEVAGVDPRELDWHEEMQDGVRAHHGQRDCRHRALGSTAAPRRIAKRNQQKSEK